MPSNFSIWLNADILRGVVARPLYLRNRTRARHQPRDQKCTVCAPPEGPAKHISAPLRGYFYLATSATPALAVARPRPGDPASGRARLLRDLQVRRAANVERLDFRLGRSPRPGSRPASSANPCRQALGPPRPGQPCSGIRVSYLPNNRRCSWRCANARRSAACSSIWCFQCARLFWSSLQSES